MKQKTAKINGSAPILMVHDVVGTANYYKDKLGFDYEKIWGEPPAFAILHRGRFSLMINEVDSNFVLSPNDKLSPNFWDVYFWTDNAHLLHEELTKSGVNIIRDIVDKPYGVREFEIKDVNGYIIAFGQEL